VPTDWAAVYQSLYGDLVRFLHRKVWDADRAQDLAQETFVRALDHDPENPRAWLFTVAANLARDEARGAVRRRAHLELVAADPPPPPADPAAETEARERAAIARAALERLSERDREALLLWDAGFSYDEIAAQTGLARTAVGTTLSRARHRLVEAHQALGGQHAALG
jgi:RNA polymerase sigma-70 factor (ECF subfamily)